VAAQRSHHERADIPDSRLRLLLQLGDIVVMPTAALLALRPVALLPLLRRRLVRLFLLMLIRRAASTTTL
jgi:hypothetical protein